VAADLPQYSLNISNIVLLFITVTTEMSFVIIRWSLHRETDIILNGRFPLDISFARTFLCKNLRHLPSPSKLGSQPPQAIVVAMGVYQW